MTPADPTRFLPLHALEFRILLVLRRGKSWGSRIVEEIEEREGGRMTLYPANLYRRVRDLVKRGLIEETDAPEGSDPRRTYLALTPLGREVTSLEAQRLRSLVHEVDALDLITDG